MELPAVDEIEISGAVKELLNRFGNVMGEQQARNIAYIALIGARGAKIESKRQQKS